MTIDSINLLIRKQYNTGEELVLFEQENQIQLTNGDTMAVKLDKLTFGELPDLEQELTDKLAFNTLIINSNLKKSALMGLYKNEDDVRTFYDIMPSDTKNVNYLLIFSYGETQPTKFTFQIESVWSVLS